MRFLIGLLVLAATMVAQSAEAQTEFSSINHTAQPSSYTPKFDPFTPEFRIVDLRLRRHKALLEEVFAYEEVGGDVFLPAQDVFRELGFEIYVESDGSLKGWFLREGQEVQYSPGAQKITIARKEYTVTRGDLRRIEGELHISLSALNRWFALNADWHSDRQLVNLTPPYLLPDEASRKRRGGRLGSRTAQELDTSGFLEIADQYEWASAPHINANFSADLNATENSSVSQFNAALLAQGDLLKTSARLSLSADGDGNANARLTLGRYDKSGGLLGPLRASYVEAGDLSTQGTPLLKRGLTGVGVRIGSDAVNRNRQFDVQDIIGEATPGWEAELYRDTELLGLQRVSSDGRYTFKNVALISGRNRFRVELYGPSGERRTQLKTIDISSKMTRPGELRYNAVVLKEGEQLFSLDQSRGLGGTPGSEAAGSDPRNYSQFDLSYGLTRHIGLSSIIAHTQGNTGRSLTDIGAGVTVQTGNAFWQFDALRQSAGGRAVRGAVSANLSGTSFSAVHEYYDDKFSSETNQSAGSNALSARTSLAASTRLFGARLNVSAGENRYRDQGRTRSAALRLSKRVVNVSASKSFQWRETSRFADRESTLDGNLSLAGSVRKTRLRLKYDYRISPQPEAGRLSFDFSRRYRSWFASAGVDHDFRNKRTEWMIGASRDVSGIRLGLDARHSPDRKDTRLLATLSLAIDRDPLSGGMRFGRDARSSRGSVRLHAFQDLNGDGLQSKDEPNVHGARFHTASRRRARSDGKAVLLEDLPVHEPESIAFDLDEIDDPYLVAAVDGLLVRPRPGKIITAALPLIESGELEILLLDENRVPVVNEVMTLVRCDGGAAIKQRSAFDGLVYFPALVPGCYKFSLASGVQASVSGVSGQNIEILAGTVERYQAVMINDRIVQFARAALDPKQSS